MYSPKDFRITDLALIHRFMERFSFATMVTMHDGHPIATLLPFLVYPDSGANGRLVSHMARANEQWRDFEREIEALVIFQGQHTYISPSWYVSQPNVPTWNYTVVHAYGVPRLIDDKERIRAMLGELVGKHEGRFDQPWVLDTVDEYVRKRMGAIVVFEFPITRLEGKFKLSQNKTLEDRLRVIGTLEKSDDPVERELAELMRTTL